MNKRTIYSAIVLLSLFTACDMTGGNPDWNTDGQASVRVKITTNGARGRTVAPNLALQDVTKWELWGGKQGDAETLLGDFSDSADAAFSLDSATWGFTLKGFKEQSLILSGSIAEQSLGAGENVLAFTVAPILEGQGDLNITVTLPAGSGITQARVFMDGTELASPLTPANEQVIFAGTYDTGVYYVSIRLYKDNVLYGAVSEIVHVWANLQSAKTYTLTNDNLNLTYVITYHLWDGETDFGYYQFTDALLTLSAPSHSPADSVFAGWYDNAGLSGEAVASIPAGSRGDKDFHAKWTTLTQAQGNTLADSLSWIATNAVTGGAYTVTISADEAIAPTSLTYSGKNVNVILNGDATERTISLTATGSLFSLGSGVTLTLGNNVTLQGRSDNTASLVQVYSGGTLVMNDGSKISGNTAPAAIGGGVYVAGTFTMSGGTISGNTASIGGGGVFVSGTFTQSGGIISGNTTTSGGGVCVSGTFTQSGGTISGNSADYGGGVNVSSNGTFTQSSGTISGNSADYGGGVYVTSTAIFTKQTGAVIYGSGAGDTLKNTATNGDSYGHAVYVASSPTKLRNSTAGSGGTLDSTVSGGAGGWETTIPANLTLAQALAWIADNAEDGGAFVVTVKNNEAIAPTALSYSGKNVSITLNGDATERTVSLSSNGSLFTVDGGVTLTLGNNVSLQGSSSNTATLVQVNDGGGLVMESGSKISGNNYASSSGGGVRVSGGTFTMNGGTISGNSAATNFSGGGVFVYSSGTFTMSGGTISGNTATNGGGGVFVSSSGTFTTSGGTISGNTASTYGGGVYVYSTGTWTQNGGTISGNAANYGGGGYVYEGGTFTQSGGTISGNSATVGGGGVWVNEGGTFTKQTGGVIYGSGASDTLKNTATAGDAYGHAVYVASSPAKVRNSTAGSSGTLNSAVSGSAGGWETAIPANLTLAQALAWIADNAEEGGAYVVTVKNNEAVAPTTLSYSGKNVSITLNGGDAERTVSLSSNGFLFTIDSGVTLTLGNNVSLQGRSSNTATLVRVNSGGALVMESGSKISGNNSTSSSGGGVQVNSNGTFTQSGGTISGNSSTYSGGGGVYVSGTFTMSGGTISGNTAPSSTYGYGGGVFVTSGTFTMSGGTISGNSATTSGGGVFVSSSVSSSGTFTQSGGTVSGNSATNGGGVYVNSNGTFTQSDGEISSNSASEYGGGVYVVGTFTMNGGTVNGNSISSSSPYTPTGGGVYVYESGTFTMNGGTVSGNSVSSSGSYSIGGGVYVYESGTFTMSGGEISGNTTSASAASFSGGVYVNGTFIMDSGTISGNSATYGGGVFVNTGTFTMNGGTVSGNTTNGNGGGVSVGWSGTFTKQAGGVIYGSGAGGTLKNTTSGDDHGHAVYVYTGSKLRNSTAGSGVTLDSAVSGSAGGWETIMSSDLSLAESLAWIASNAEEGGAYTLTVKNNEAIAPTTLSYSGKNVSISIVGDATERTVSLSATGSLFTVDSGVTLTLGNNVSLQGRSDNTTPLVWVNGGATLVMSNGSKISGNTNTASEYGGGVYVYEYGTFTMNGGNITQNTAPFGGGVYVAYATFTMSGGNIGMNNASANGGGVNNNGTFTQSGGEISYNFTYGNGGGVYTSGGTFTQSGGEIRGNSAVTDGGGVFVYGNATFTKQTGGVIYGSEDEANHNSASEGQAVYISSSPAKVRNDTAFSHVTLDSAVSGSAGGWEDPAPAPSATVQVSLVPMADDPALTDVSLFANEAAQFSTDSGYASWAWYWNGEPISGASASTYTITANSKTPGIYELSVVVTTSAGETLSAWCKVVVKTN